MRTSITTPVIAVLLLCLCCQQSMAQQMSISDSLMQKSKDQKTGAWILLSAGAVLAASSFAVQTKVDDFNNPFDVFNGDKYHGFGAKGVLMIVGVAAMAGSYFLFAAAARNKKTAMRLNVTSQQISMPIKGGWASHSQPAITFSITLGGH